MLAERRKREKWSLNPRGNFWSNDASKFGQQMLEKMGWKPGGGLGAKEQGITEQIRVTYKNDKTCIGFKEHGQEWLEQQSQFENLLAELGNSHDAAVSGKRNESLELRSRESRARVHYRKFTRGKDLSNYSEKDLACILGVQKSRDVTDYESIKERKNSVDTFIGKVDNLYGVTTVNGGNMNDYFVKKKHKSIDIAPEEICANKQKERERPEVGDSDRRAETVTKEKHKHGDTERSEIQEKVDGQETKENELKLKYGSVNSLKRKRKTRKMENVIEGKYLLNNDERSDREINSEQYCEKNVHHVEEKSDNFVQECKTKKKRKENQHTAGKEVWQETGESEMNDSANCFNYKKKKRKMEQMAKEHLLKEEEIIKQNVIIGIKESYDKKDMNPEVDNNNKVKRNKKRKERDTECTDTIGKEVEADRNKITLLNGDSISSMNSKKKKLKQEVDVKFEDKITEQGKKVNKFISVVPESCYTSKDKHVKNSFQGNNESVDYQKATVTAGSLLHKKDLFRKLKHCMKFVDGDTEVDHSEKRDHGIEEEEIRNDKLKKKKKRKHGKDEKTPVSEEHECMQYSLEETEAMGCDRGNCEELSGTSEMRVSLNCRNSVRKEKRRIAKILNKNCVHMDLECEKDERLQKQDIETNEQTSKTIIKNDNILNDEDSKEAINNSKNKQDIYNPSVENSAGANIELADFENIDICRRNMRPSVFAKLVYPSLVRFRGSNLHRIPGYGKC